MLTNTDTNNNLLELEPEQIQLSSWLLIFATGEYLRDSYFSFISTILADYRHQFDLYHFEAEAEALNSALLVAYSEGFLYPTFPELLFYIRTWPLITPPPLPLLSLDYTSHFFIELFQTVYDWSVIHAQQFREVNQAVFTRHLKATPAMPSYAFTLICSELHLPLEKWLQREFCTLRYIFGSAFPSLPELNVSQSLASQLTFWP